jgi:hypothetical protein
MTMKKIINYFIYAVAVSGLSQVASAQELTFNEKAQNRNSLLAIDSTRKQRMETDLNKRNLMTNTGPVTWKESDYGYNGTYSSDYVQYMALYDRDGKYVETLAKKEWNKSAPQKLRSSYEQSQYKSQEVTGYWETTDPGRKGYYLEFKDDTNNPAGIWVNEDGGFSTWPSKKSEMKKNNDTSLKPDSTVKRDH